MKMAKATNKFETFLVDLNERHRKTGLTLKQLAEKLGSNHQTLRELLAGESVPQPAFFGSILEFYKFEDKEACWKAYFEFQVNKLRKKIKVFVNK